MATSSFYSSTGPTAEDVTALQGFKNDAEASKNAAAASAAAAAVSENNSGNSAVDSQNAQQASEAARNAAIAARDAALLSETTATSAAASSLAQAGIASTKANEASASESTATTEAAEAAASAAAALLSEDNSSASETASAASAAAALSSENNASGSAATATSQAGIATTKASEASSSAANALASENAASGSSASALAQAGIATTKAGEAAVSASDALVSEGNASNSATSAATAQTAAEAARDAALAAFDSFDDRYLGVFSNDPTTDNDGDALASGMLYFNDTTDEMKVYEGSSWVAAYASLSGALIANNNLSDLNNAGTARTNLGLGTAATTAASDYATAAQADQTVALTGAGATSISGTYPNFTITSTDNNTTYTAGTGLSLTGTEFANTAPDQTVALTGAGATSISGTYPNFTITSTDTVYTLPFTDNSSNWDTAFGWGNHASAGYLTSHQDISGKLDSSAYTAADVLTKIKTVDGSGSGLDADLLDGYNSAENGASTIHRLANNGYSQLQNWTNIAGSGIYSSTTNSAHFSPNTATTYATWQSSGSKGGYDGILFDSGGDVAIMYDSSGNGGMYRQANGRWHVYHHVANNCLAIGSSGTSSSYSAYVHGALYATGNITAYSDARIKENVVTIDSALEKVESMRGVYYNKIDDPDKTKEVGFIAQEVNEVIPEAVTYAEDVDQYGVKYANITALLVESVKELSQQVKDLQAEVKELKENG